jgi:hypothetical protein
LATLGIPDPHADVKRSAPIAKIKFTNATMVAELLFASRREEAIAEAP